MTLLAMSPVPPASSTPPAGAIAPVAVEQPPPPAIPEVHALTEFFERQLLGNSLWDWLIALVVGLLIYFGLSLARAIVLRRLRKLAAHSKRTGIDLAVELVQGTAQWFFIVVAISFATSGLLLPAPVARILHYIVVGGVALQIAGWANTVVVFLIRRYLQKRGRERGETDGAVETTMVAVRFISLFVVYALVAVIAIDNLGFDVTALITGLGVGGIAIALAVQNILGDLFSALSIVLDKPFVVGDFIIVGEQMGTVENIGLKSTRVRALSGELLVFRNTDLLAARIQNFKQMQERRVVFKVGVTYSTPPELVARIPQVIRDTIKARDKVRFDRAHFSRFADSALEFEAVYYMLSADYNQYMDTQQAINLELLNQFRAMNVEFAFPSQTLYFAGGNTAGPGAPPPFGPGTAPPFAPGAPGPMPGSPR